MNDAPAFSLLHEPWIEVQLRDGSDTALSIRDVFARADDIVEVLGESPTQSLAIMRLLLAILHAALEGPEGETAWRELYEASALPVDKVEQYLREYEDRFYLVHPQTPFYQVNSLSTAKGEVASVAKIIADVPAGAQLFTSRSGSAAERLSFPEAARWLVQVQAYDISGIKSGAVGDPRVKGGKGYPIGTGYAGSLGGLYLKSDTLTETLILNLVSGSQVGEPVWERVPQTAAPESPDPDVLRTPTGLADLYTWQSRRVRLVVEAEHVVGVVLSNGDKILAHDMRKQEPMTMWRRSPTQEKKLGYTPVYFPLTHDPGRALWRSAEALMLEKNVSNQSGEADRYLAPGVLRHLVNLDDDLDSHKSVSIRAIGMQYGTQQAVTDEVFDDSLAVEIGVLTAAGRHIRVLIVDVVAETIEACKAVGLFAADIARAAGGDNDIQVARRDVARERAYAAIDLQFRQWLHSLHAESDTEEAHRRWHETARAVLKEIETALVDSAPPGAIRGRDFEHERGKKRRLNVGTASTYFNSRLKRALLRAYPATATKGTNAS